MYPPNIILWCFVLLLVVSSSESRGNSTNDNERTDHSTMRYDSFISSVKYRNDKMKLTQCDLRENFKNNDKMQYESRINSTKNDRKDDDLERSRGHIVKKRVQDNLKMSMEPRVNSTEINDTILQEINENLMKTEGDSNFTSTNELYGNSNTDNYNNITFTIVPYEACDVTCIQLCCPFGNNLTAQGYCIAGQGNYSFPGVYENDSEGKRNKLFRLTIRDPCVEQGFGRRILFRNEYLFLINGSLYQGPGKFILPTSYCLAITTRNIYDVIVCTNQMKFPIYISVCLLISLPFLLLTFVIYSLLPELQSIHGYILRAHVASLFITYAIMYFGQQHTRPLAKWRYCVPLGTVCIKFL